MKLAPRAATVVALTLGLLAAPLAAEAQPVGKIPRIGFLANIRSPATEAFERGLRELGYVEGKSIVIEWRLAQGRFERLPELAAELVRLNVRVIVAPASPYVQAARNATSTIPIVFALVVDPVAQGFVSSLARPGGNVTGLSPMTADLLGKRLELLKEAVPGARRVAGLHNPAAAWRPEHLKEAETAAHALGMQLQLVEVGEPGGLDGAFSAIAKERAGAVLVLEHPMFFAHRARIAELALRHRLPTMFGLREFVEAGGLMVYAASTSDLMRRSAAFVAKILKGAKPADLPVEQPTKFEFVINVKTAKALGLTIPQSVLIRADELIQ